MTVPEARRSSRRRAGYARVSGRVGRVFQASGAACALVKMRNAEVGVSECVKRESDVTYASPLGGSDAAGGCVAVLGAAGFLGQHVTLALLARGYAVRAFDRLPFSSPLLPGGAHPRLTVLTGDFFDARCLEAALAGCSCCVHLVSTSIPQSSNADPSRDVKQNLLGALGLLEAMRTVGVPKIVFASSGGTVYGIPHTRRIAETHPTHPLCSYGIVKLTVEKYLALYRELHGLEYVALRVGNPYGPLQRLDASQGVIGVFLGRILHNQPLTVWGDGSVVRDFVYVEDVAHAFVLAAASNIPAAVLNIGSGSGASLKRIIELLQMTTRRQVDVRYLAGRVFDVPCSILDIALARQMLGWQPAVTMEEGLRRTWAWVQGSE